MPCIKCGSVWVCGPKPTCDDLPPSLDLVAYSLQSDHEALRFDEASVRQAYAEEPAQESASADTSTDEPVKWYFGGRVSLMKRRPLYMWCGEVKLNDEVAYAVVVGHSKQPPTGGGMTWTNAADGKARVDTTGEYYVWYRTPEQGGWEVAVVP
jgi:hypothetical protein